MILDREQLNKLHLAVAPGKHDPHPCLERCRRTGGPVKLAAYGRCPECGRPTEYNVSTFCELHRAAVLELIAMAKEHLRLTSALTYLDADGARAVSDYRAPGECDRSIHPDRIIGVAALLGWKDLP